MSTLQIRPDIRAEYSSLFGPKTVNGRTVVAEDVITRLTEAVSGELPQLLAERLAFQDRVGRKTARYAFLPGSEKVSDADGNETTVAAIRRGMLDGFFGRKTAEAWQANATVPIPPDTMRPGLEGTGPAIDMGMAMGALNSGASQWMWDWEDAGGDYKDQLYRGWVNLIDILAHNWDGKPYVHPTKKRTYTIDVPPEKWPMILHRVAGIHLRNRQMTLNGEPIPAIIPGLVIHALNNFESQKRNGSGIYYYIPKIETWQEARLVAKLLKGLEEAMGVKRGTLKIKMLNERAEYVLQQEAIMWVLRENLIGPNVGRWDYINSREEMFRHDPAMVIPDPHAVTMTEPSMSYYTMRNALLALLAGAMPIGGMAAQMQNPRAPETRREGAARHLVRQAARAAHGTLPDRREIARHLPSELGGDSRSRLRRRRSRAARHRHRRSAARRRQGNALTSVPASKDLGLLESGRVHAARAHGRRSDRGEAVFERGAWIACLRARNGPTTEDGHALRDVHGHGIHVSAAPRQQRCGDLRPEHGAAVHERPRDVRDLLALPVSHRVSRRGVDGRRQDDEKG